MFYKNLPRATTCFSFFSARMRKREGGAAMPWSEMLFPLLFLALGAACLWAAWVFRRFAKKRETTYTVKAWAQVVQVLCLCRFRRGPPVHPGPPPAGRGGGLHQAGLPHPGGRPVPERAPGWRCAILPAGPPALCRRERWGPPPQVRCGAWGPFSALWGRWCSWSKTGISFFRPRSIKFIKTLDFSF